MCNLIAVFSLSPDSCVRLRFTEHFSSHCRSHTPPRTYPLLCELSRNTLCVKLFNSSEWPLLLDLILTSITLMAQDEMDNVLCLFALQPSNILIVSCDSGVAASNGEHHV